MPVRKKVVVCQPNANNVYILDEDGPSLDIFDPPLTSPETNFGAHAIWGSLTGELICSPRKTSDNNRHAYHYEGGTAWIDYGTVYDFWDIHGTSYANVWACTGDSQRVQHFNGTLWVVDAILSGSRIHSIHSCGPGLDEVFAAAENNIWFRTGGSPGLGTWVDRRAQLLTDTGLDISAALPDCAGVFAVSKTEVYWLIGAWSNTTSHWIVKWNGSNFSIVSTTSVNTYGISESSFDGKSSNEMWWMQTDPSWGRFHFLHFNGSTITRQESPQHYLNSGANLVLDPDVPGVGYAAGGYQSPYRIAIWKLSGGAWSYLTARTIGFSDYMTGIHFWVEAIPSPVVSDTHDVEATVIARDVVKLTFTNPVAVTKSLLSPRSYEITRLSGIAQPAVAEVLPLEDHVTTVVFLKLSPKARFEDQYQLVLPSAGTATELFDDEIPDTTLYSRAGDLLGRMETNWTHYRTKVDTVLASLAGLYDLEFKSNLRSILQVVSFSDEEIGGGQVTPAIELAQDVVYPVPPPPIIVEETEDMPSPHVVYVDADSVDVELPLVALGNTVGYKLQDGVVYGFAGGETCDLTLSGVGGLDTGSRANDTWYYLYLVPDSGALKPIFSATDPDSGGPSGYTEFLPVVAVLNETAAIRPFFVAGRDVYWPTGKTALSGSAYINPAALQDISASCPKSADLAHLRPYAQHDGTAGYSAIIEIHVEGYLSTETGNTISTTEFDDVWAAHNEWTIAGRALSVPVPGSTKRIGVRVYTDESGTPDNLNSWNVRALGWREKYRY